MFEVWCLLLVASTLDSLGWECLDGPAALHLGTGVIYRYRSPAGHDLKLRFQRKDPLPKGRWSYRDGNPLPWYSRRKHRNGQRQSASASYRRKEQVHLLNRIARSEETYKMLGYAENFGPATPPTRFEAS